METKSELQAKAQLESIIEMVDALDAAHEANDNEVIDKAELAIREDPLSFEVRSGWYILDGTGHKPEEYKIMLCWGGPACRIIGGLSEHGEPETAQIEHQDWGTLWIEYPIDSEAEDKVLTYARCFCFSD